MQTGDFPKEYLENDKKHFKKQINKLARTLLYYEGTMLVVGILYIVVYMIIKILSNPTASLTDEVTDSLFTQLMESGTPSILGVIFGMIFILLYRKKTLFTYDLRIVNKKMNKISFVHILFCFMSVQLIFITSSGLFEGTLNYFGYTIQDQIATATETSTTISMLLYVSFIGPIVEEVVFRGAILRSLEGYGKTFAIIVSSILFGCLHANLMQSLFATVIGLVLGYVALEYSIKWAILLHIINNFLFGDVLGLLTKDLSLILQNIISYGIIIIFFIGGLIILIKKRNQIKKYISTNRTEKSFYKYTFTSVWFIIFIILNLLLALAGIEKLS